MKNPTISVVIPVRNEAANIRDCLEGILNQTLEVQEIVVVDSGSTDGTLEILNEYDNVKTIRIDPADFNHGLTRNLGVRHAQGDLVVLTVGDARPANDRWLENMVRHFNDPEVAGVCGQQVVPHEKGKNPHEWFRPQHPPDVKKYQFHSRKEFDDLAPLEQYNACRWDDVTAVYRREVNLQHPFQPVTYGEDMVWAREVLCSGKKIVYDTSAKIYHYHNTSYSFQVKRTLTLLYHVYRYFDYIKPNPVQATDPFRIIYRNLKYKAGWEWIPYNFLKITATCLAHWQFRRWLKRGEAYLDQKHQATCGIPPQPAKRTAAG